MALDLILARHAKSSWDDPLQDDHDRPLNARGRAAAPLIGAWLAAGGHVPRAAVASSARRTRETWALMAPALGPDAPALAADRRLYLASPDTMLAVLHEAEASPLVMIGHNDGIAAFARWLLARPPAHARFAHFPTGATLVARFQAACWADVVPGSGQALGFVVPRDLG